MSPNGEQPSKDQAMGWYADNGSLNNTAGILTCLRKSHKISYKAPKRNRRHALAVRSLADGIRRKWEESAVKPITLVSYSESPAQGSLEKMLHLRVAVNQKKRGKGPLFGRVTPYGKGHQHDVASPLRTKGPHWCAMEKGGPNVLGASNHLGHRHVTAPSSGAGCPAAMNCYRG